MNSICETVDGLRLFLILKSISRVVFVVVPTILIVYLTIDAIKIIAGYDQEKKTQVFKTSVRRIVACMVIYLVPTIFNMSMTFLNGSGLEFKECYDNATFENIKLLEAEEKKKDEEEDIFGTDNNDDNSIFDITKDDDSNSSNSSNNNNNSIVDDNNNNETPKEETNQEPKEEIKKLEYTIENTNVVIAHFHNHKTSKSKIVIKNSNGKVISNKKFTFNISKPIATISKKGNIKATFAGTAKITVYPNNDETNKQTIQLTVIKGTYAKVRTTEKLKAINLKTGKKETLAEGTEGVYNGSTHLFNSDASHKLYYPGDTLKVGKNYYSVPYTSVKAYEYSISKNYSKEIAEEFINSNNFKSDTKYLFWMNLGSQANYFFKRKKGKWVLVKVMDINSGDVLGLHPEANGGNCNGSRSNPPLAYGLGSCSSINSTDIDGYRLDRNWKGSWLGLSLVIYVHRDDGGGFGAWHEAYVSPKYPRSHGCVRHRTEDMLWVKNNLSKLGGSRIVRF